jgi:hypothetical protein
MIPNNILFRLVRTHPTQAALHFASAMAFVEPRVITTPVYWALGFGSKGPDLGMLL